MLFEMLGNERIGVHRRSQHESDFALLHQVGRTVAHAGFRTAVTNKLEAHRTLVEKCRLLGITHIELEVVKIENRKFFSAHCF